MKIPIKATPFPQAVGMILSLIFIAAVMGYTIVGFLDGSLP